ncbi:hypothetical protein [Longispora albida]|uniref:hypothetical protein n=1 Tax=Longispora albida TaxID=203523 RepID=UPI000370E8CC|nr:hypothetical protein [Longispora albida]
MRLVQTQPQVYRTLVTTGLRGGFVLHEHLTGALGGPEQHDPDAGIPEPRRTAGRAGLVAVA